MLMNAVYMFLDGVMYVISRKSVVLRVRGLHVATVEATSILAAGVCLMVTGTVAHQRRDGYWPS